MSHNQAREHIAQMRQILRERDSMTCRSCSNEERASEGYPCADCGTFICIICTFRGVVYCRKCEPQHADSRNQRSA
jgi:late competence protein required for DNA uptake (superfamily II DNA/RNA helicase)